MPFYPQLAEEQTYKQVTDTFLGYNHNAKIAEGEFYDMENLTGDYAPMLANRAKRTAVMEGCTPRAILGKANLAVLDGNRLLYGGEDVTGYLTAKGLTISADETMLPKKLLSMGAYLLILPDRLYLNTEDFTDCGSIDASYESVGSVSYALCDITGSPLDEPSTSPTAPEAPENGALWIDTSGETHVLKQWSATSSMWNSLSSVYTKISCPGIGTQFSQYDGVKISGCSAAGTAMEKQIDALNGSKIIYAKDDHSIVVVGLLDYLYTQSSGSVTVARRMPDLDYITEAKNRLWGCKYGLVDGETVNVIHCCALGDFKNWEKFMGVSTDSWYGFVGTDGKWTGAVTHLNHPLFFKENVLHKVYINDGGAHSVVDTACRGVQDGCSESLVVVNEVLYYKSRGGVCAYDGSLPVSAGEALGKERYGVASAGGFGNKYYISMQDAGGTWSLFCYDTSTRMWHREDSTHAEQFARCADALYFIDGGTVKAIGTADGTQEGAIAWSATTGVIGYTTVEQKYVSRFTIRMMLDRGSCMDVFLQYDSDGIWHHCGHVAGSGTRTFTLPVRPRRCDHFNLKLEGRGDFRVYSMQKVMEIGSDEP